MPVAKPELRNEPWSPALKRPCGSVLDCLHAAGAVPEALAPWHHLAAKQLRPKSVVADLSSRAHRRFARRASDN